MEINVRGQNIEVTEALSSHLDARLEAALGQYGEWVREVNVRLEDVNGPKGGVDKECHLTIRLKPTGTLVVDEVNEDMYAAISVAAGRAKVAAGREIDKRRSK